MEESQRIISAAHAHQQIKGHFIYIMGMIPRVPAVQTMPMKWAEEHFEDRADFVFLGKPCRLKLIFAWLDNVGYVGQVTLQMREDDGKITDVRPVFLIDATGNIFLNETRRRGLDSHDQANLAAIITHVLGMLVPGPR
jgi:hypothetical protein